MTSDQIQAPVTLPEAARRNVLRAIERRLRGVSDYVETRGLLKLHDWIMDNPMEMTDEEFACLLVAAGYCPKHLTEPADGRCIPCDNGFPSVFEERRIG